MRAFASCRAATVYYLTDSARLQSRLLCKTHMQYDHEQHHVMSAYALHTLRCRDGAVEPALRDQYAGRIDEGLRATLARLKKPWPRELMWFDARNITIKKHFAGLAYPVSSKNDELLIVRDFHGTPAGGAILGVELKKALTRQVCGCGDQVATQPFAKCLQLLVASTNIFASFAELALHQLIDCGLTVHNCVIGPTVGLMCRACVRPRRSSCCGRARPTIRSASS
jgi:hypothetical protein